MPCNEIIIYFHQFIYWQKFLINFAGNKVGTYPDYEKKYLYNKNIVDLFKNLAKKETKLFDFLLNCTQLNRLCLIFSFFCSKAIESRYFKSILQPCKSLNIPRKAYKIIIFERFMTLQIHCHLLFEF